MVENHIHLFLNFDALFLIGLLAFPFLNQLDVLIDASFYPASNSDRFCRLGQVLSIFGGLCLGLDVREPIEERTTRQRTVSGTERRGTCPHSHKVGTSLLTGKRKSRLSLWMWPSRVEFSGRSSEAIAVAMRASDGGGVYVKA